MPPTPTPTPAKPVTADDFNATRHTLKPVAEVFPEMFDAMPGTDADREAARRRSAAVKIPCRPPGEFTFKERDPNYHFRKDLVRLAIFWLMGNIGGRSTRNMMLTGPTGAGKTTFFEQLSARTGWEFLNFACHKHTEYHDLIGAKTLKKDGTIGWVPGPAILAAKRGGILNLDEVDFLDPGTIGGLNNLLDGHPYLIPDTGDIVVPHPDFRISATGNSIGGENRSNYKGTGKLNLAFKDRFIGARVDYMSEAEETKIIMSTHPVDSGVLQVLIATAAAVRSLHNQGSLSETLSSRNLFRWAAMLHTQCRENDAEATQKAQLDKVPEFLNNVLGFHTSPTTWGEIEGALKTALTKQFPNQTF